MKILVINGPNINMLGIREPDIYGKETYINLVEKIEKYAKENWLEVKCFQSNHEGDIVDEIQKAYNNFDGIVINPAASNASIDFIIVGVVIPISLAIVLSAGKASSVSLFLNLAIAAYTSKSFGLRFFSFKSLIVGICTCCIVY